MKLEFFVLLLGAFVLACLSGPIFHFRPKPSTAVVAAVEAAPNLDIYLRDQEAQEPDLHKDLAKAIVWADPYSQKKTPLSIVYLHGFSASRKDLSPVIESLSGRIHANTYFARLKAHGLDDGGEAFATVRPQDWLNDAREALAIGKRIGDRVVVVGISTGALLATMLVTEGDREGIAALILLSPNFGLKDWRAPFVSGPMGRWIAKRLIGPYRIFPSENPSHEHAWTHRYRTEGLVALNDLVNYGKGLHLHGLGVPTLMLYTSHDQIIDVSAIRDRFEEIQDSRKLLIDMPLATRHELAGDALARENNDATIQAIVNFLSQHIPVSMMPSTH